MAGRSNTGRVLQKKWAVDVKHALFRKTGDWYHQLEEFPGALFDADGYVIFESEEAYRACPQLRIKQDVSVPGPGGIKDILGYVRVVFEGVERLPSRDLNATHEGAIRLREGAPIDVVQTRYERDPRARKLCLQHHGLLCAACGLSFEKRYGELGKSFIHVHHQAPLALGGEEHEVDPLVDLIPVCPNCHAMLHRRTPPLSIDALKAILARHGA